jgi:hypothetical protein
MRVESCSGERRRTLPMRAAPMRSTPSSRTSAIPEVILTQRSAAGSAPDLDLGVGGGAARAHAGAQVVHRNREWLAANAPFGGMLRSIYAQLGSPLPAPANLAAYQLRQWGVTGDPDANGALHVRASILNTAAEFNPIRCCA